MNDNTINVRSERELYPDYTAELEALHRDGVTVDIVQKIIRKHKYNAERNKKLYARYITIKEGLPIFNRVPRFSDDPDAINNKLAHDFLGEVVDFKTGYFAGTAVKYDYAHTDEASEETGGDEAVEAASQLISDFVTRCNMRDVNLQVTKRATIYGYAGRLMYIDTEGNERAMAVHGYETIILSATNICEPEYAIRYYKTKDLNGVTVWRVEAYDNKNIYYFKGSLGHLLPDTERENGEVEPHLFDYCPLQGIANNDELIGDAEKVITLIDDYDKNVSDNSNEVEAFVHALLVVENVNISDEELTRSQHTGGIQYPSNPARPGKMYYLTKNINDAFTEHHLERLKDNIYRFSKTPNLTDDAFGTASGIALRFKLHGLDTKCDMFESKFQTADTYMFKVLASSWGKKGDKVDYLQCTSEYTRSFPLDELQEVQTAQGRLSAGLPKRWVFSKMASVDDVDHIMKMINEEKDDIAPLDQEPDWGFGESGDEPEIDNAEKPEGVI